MKMTYFTPPEEQLPAAPFMDLGDFDKVDMIESPPGLYGQEPPRAVNNRRLGILGVVSITYMYICAGPIGSEEVISSSGPLVGLLGFLFYALLIAFPYAYIVAELCSAFPEDGGFTVWVLNAFGPFWGFQVGYWSWIAGVLRGALVPGTLLDLITKFYKLEIKSAGLEYAIKMAIAIVLAVPTLLGTRAVSRLSILVMTLVLLFFSVFTVWALVKASDFDDLFEVRHEVTEYNPETKDLTLSGGTAIQWVTLINTLFYKYKGINNASVFGGEVQNPARSYSRAIAIIMLLIVATYVVPVTAGLVSDGLSWSMLDRNSFPFLAFSIGGSFLRGLIQVAACCASAGMFIAMLHVKAFMISGMAENRLVPELLGRRSNRFQSPTHAALLTLVLMLALLSVDFDDMLPMTNAYSAAAQLLIIATVVRLRRELPYIPRPTKVPGGIPVLCSIAVLPTFMFGYVTFYAFSSTVSAILMVAFFVPGVAYGVYRFHYRRALA
ncbi:hypothetical protein BBJ28_00015086 [Nothophytophthora sp. Chile5]|nr:hypothetical protein BBJ28_00015086 [Nothophytophthora sp. Chile5]